MVKLREVLAATTAQWRRIARNTRLAAGEIPNLLARGHMHGMSDGLEVAAADIDTMLSENEAPLADAKSDK